MNLFWAHWVLVCLVLWFWFGFLFCWDFFPKSISHHIDLWISVLIFETQGLLIERNCISHVKMWTACIYQHILTLGNTHWLLKIRVLGFITSTLLLLCILFHMNLMNRSIQKKEINITIFFPWLKLSIIFSSVKSSWRRLLNLWMYFTAWMFSMTHRNLRFVYYAQRK